MSDQQQFVKGKRYEVKSPSGKWRTLIFEKDMIKCQLFKFVRRPSKRGRKRGHH